MIDEPGHPDANGDGYVAYPNISIAREFAEANLAALELTLLAGRPVCETSSLAFPVATLIKYRKSGEAALDTLSFSTEGRSDALVYAPDGTASLR